MDPQQRLLMETVYLAMESAGLTIPGMQGSDTADYVGVMCIDYTTPMPLTSTMFPSITESAWQQATHRLDCLISSIGTAPV
jgi:acyl transferase domain-containing protein